MVEKFERFLSQPQVKHIEISPSILKSGAQLRASNPSLRTPDAVHVATAVAQGCKLFLTNDIALRKLREISTSILNDFVP